MTKYEQHFAVAKNNPEEFWAQQAESLHWFKRWDKVLDSDAKPIYSWFRGATCNTCYNAVDRHVDAGYGEQRAVIYDSPVSNSKSSLSFAELQEQCARAAGALRQLGVGKGDRVLIYMPMIPEALIAMLACARLGAVHSVVFGGFAAAELAKRMVDAAPSALISASCGIEPTRIIDYKPMLNEARALAGMEQVPSLIVQRQQSPCELQVGIDKDWHEALAAAAPVDCVAIAATDPLYILYTSGTTGQPKGIVRDNGGHMVALSYSMSAVYNANPGEVYWAASDIGWVVGHSYIVYAPLLTRQTTLIFEGKPAGTPDAGAFWRVASEYGVNTMFTAPTALRVIKKEDPEGKLLKQYDMSKLRALFLAGERCDPNSLAWAETMLQKPVIDHWWQTETGWAIAASCTGLETTHVRSGSAGKAVPGFDVRVLDSSGDELPAGEMGAVCVRLPLPPSCLNTIWQAQDVFVDKYLRNYPGYYESGDAGIIDADGYVSIMARTDDVINVAGHRLSTGQMEEVLADHPEVAEACVFGVQDAIKGQLPMGLLVLKADSKLEHEQIRAQCVQMARERIGAVAALKSVHVVQRLPKTRSGKILRATLRKLADGEQFTTPATIDDPVILDEIAAVLHAVQ